MGPHFVPFTRQEDLMILFQVVIERASQLLCRQPGHEIRTNPSMFQNDRFAAGKTKSFEIADTCPAIHLQRSTKQFR